MFDYFKPQEYFIDHIWFHYAGTHYKGNGILNWNPDGGFHIAARVKSSKLNLPLHKDFKAITFDTSTCLHMKLNGGLRAVAPNVFPDEVGLIYGQLSVNASRVIFIQQTTMPTKSSWFGSALFEIRKNILLPDTVSIETRIGDSQPRQSLSMAGIHYTHESGLKVIGYRKENKYLELNWNLPLEQWRKTECWDFAKGLQNSISILAGEVIQLKYREVYRANRIFREVVVSEKASSLGIIFRPFDLDILDKDLIVKLAEFFTRGDYKADVSRKVFHQMAEAARQRTRQGQELLLSTILEAALRSVYKQPFDPRNKKRAKSFRIDQYLKKFREEYLSSTPEDKALWDFAGKGHI